MKFKQTNLKKGILLVKFDPAFVAVFDMFCFFVVVVVVVMSYFLAAVTFYKFLMTVNERGKLVNQEKTAEISRRHHWFIRE